MLKCEDQTKYIYLKSEFTFPSYLRAPNISSTTLGPQINYHFQIQTLGFLNKTSEVLWRYLDELGQKKIRIYLEHPQILESKFSRTQG